MSHSELHIPTIRTDGLQLDEQRDIQRRIWTAQRVGWAAFVVIGLLALAGLTGKGGPFHIQRVSLGAHVVEAPRVARWEAPDRMTVRLAAGEGSRTIAVDDRFATDFDIERIVPEPSETRLVADGILMVFPAEPGQEQAVSFAIRPRRAGFLDYTVVADGERRDLRVLVLP